MKISFEIVPRSAEAFIRQYEFVLSLGERIDMINVPDIQRFNLRSWELVNQIDQQRHIFVPHFRAIDFAIRNGTIFQIIEHYQLSHVLLISGDPPEGINRQFYSTNVVDLIGAVKQRFPAIKIYAGFDPHRHGIQDEYNYIMRKVEAGASAFFSQPFFDTRMIEIYAEHLQGLETFIGISPITTASSKQYWEVKNKVKFPAGFQAEYDWNVKFANRALEIARNFDLNIYFMPIRIDLEKYFAGIHL